MQIFDEFIFFFIFQSLSGNPKSDQINYFSMESSTNSLEMQNMMRHYLNWLRWVYYT